MPTSLLCFTSGKNAQHLQHMLPAVAVHGAQYTFLPAYKSKRMLQHACMVRGCEVVETNITPKPGKASLNKTSLDNGNKAAIINRQ